MQDVDAICIQLKCDTTFTHTPPVYVILVSNLRST